MKITRILTSLGLTASFCLTSPAAMAQTALLDYPTRPIRLVVPFPPGGGTDILARVIGNELAKDNDWTIVADNRAGAGGTIGLNDLTRAPANGYTMAMGQKDNLIVGAWIYPNLTWNPIHDFVPVAHVAHTPHVIATAANSPYHTLQDVIDAAKKAPNAISYASPGNGTSVHLAGHAFAQSAGIDLLHIAYRGSSPAIADALAGNVDILLSSLPSAMGQIEAGNLRVLAVTSGQRSALYPQIPTVAEAAGLEGFDISTWYGLLMPKDTPAAVADLVNEKVTTLLNQEGVQALILRQGAEPQAMSRQAFSDLIAKDYAEWEAIVASSGARVE